MIDYNTAVTSYAASIKPPRVFMQPSESMSRLTGGVRPCWILRNSTHCLGRVDAISGRVHRPLRIW